MSQRVRSRPIESGVRGSVLERVIYSALEKGKTVSTGAQKEPTGERRVASGAARRRAAVRRAAARVRGSIWTDDGRNLFAEEFRVCRRGSNGEPPNEASVNNRPRAARGSRSSKAPANVCTLEEPGHYSHCSANNATPPANLFDSRVAGTPGWFNRDETIIARFERLRARERKCEKERERGVDISRVSMKREGGRGRETRNENGKKEEIASRAPRVPMVLIPMFESTPPFTIRPNYPSGNPFRWCLFRSRVVSPLPITRICVLEPDQSRDWILVNSLLFRLRDEPNKGVRPRFLSSPPAPAAPNGPHALSTVFSSVASRDQSIGTNDSTWNGSSSVDRSNLFSRRLGTSAGKGCAGSGGSQISLCLNELSF